MYGAPGVRSPFSYGLRGTPVGARVGAQPSQHAPVVPDRIVALGRLDNLNHSREACVAHDPSERRGPDPPFADPLLGVAAAAGRRPGTVGARTLWRGGPHRLG